jgi:hypothetical protein
LAGLIATGCGTVRGGYESARYQVVRASDKFEVRDYPELTVVETPVARSGNGPALDAGISASERGNGEDQACQLSCTGPYLTALLPGEIRVMDGYGVPVFCAARSLGESWSSKTGGGDSRTLPPSPRHE